MALVVTSEEVRDYGNIRYRHVSYGGVPGNADVIFPADPDRVSWSAVETITPFFAPFALFGSGGNRISLCDNFLWGGSAYSLEVVDLGFPIAQITFRFVPAPGIAEIVRTIVVGLLPVDTLQTCEVFRFDGLYAANMRKSLHTRRFSDVVLAGVPVLTEILPADHYRVAYTVVGQTADVLVLSATESLTGVFAGLDSQRGMLVHQRDYGPLVCERVFAAGVSGPQTLIICELLSVPCMAAESTEEGEG